MASLRFLPASMVLILHGIIILIKAANKKLSHIVFKSIFIVRCFLTCNIKNKKNKEFY